MQLPSLPVLAASAIGRADELWRLNVVDDPKHVNFQAIRDVIHHGVRNNQKYEKSGDYEWCTAFAFGWCQLGDAAAGVPELDPEIREHLAPSTVRLWIYGSYGYDANLWPHRTLSVGGAPPAPIRSVHAKMGSLRVIQTPKATGLLTWDPQPGDIATVRPTYGDDKKTRPWGGHGFLIESYDPIKKTVATYEGNAGGRGPKGPIRDGVVRNIRPVSTLMMIIRPSACDYLPGLRWGK